MTYTHAPPSILLQYSRATQATIELPFFRKIILQISVNPLFHPGMHILILRDNVILRTYINNNSLNPIVVSL